MSKAKPIIWTPLHKKFVKLCLKHGYSYPEIANEIGGTYDQIEHAIRRYDLRAGISDEEVLFKKTKNKIRKEDVGVLAKILGEKIYNNYRVIKLDSPKPKKSNAKKEEHSILDISDVHIGMINDVFDSTLGKKVTTYNMDIFKKELNTLQKSVADIHSILSNSYNLRKLTIFMLGDIITNDRIFEEQKFEIEKVVGLQIWDAINHFTCFFNNLLSVYEEIEVVSVVGNHGRCFDSETRILTTEGWKYGTELKENEKVATLNMKNNRIEWHQITDRYYYNTHTEMCKAKTSSADIVVTPNHEMVVGKDGVYKKVFADTLVGQWNVNIPTTAPSQLSEYPISDDYIKLLGWILTDGSIIKKQGYIQIYQSKEQNIAKIRNLLNQLDIKFSEGVRSRKTTHICGRKLLSTRPEHTFRILAESSKKVNEILQLNKKRELPSWCFNLSDRQVNILMMTLIDGDGNTKKAGIGKDGYSREESYTLWGTKKALEQFQALFLTHNIACSVNQNNRNDYYLVIRQTKNITIGKVNKFEKVPYKGTTWCVTVPNNTVIVERNGKPFIAGNSLPHSYNEPVENSFEYFIYKSWEKQFENNKRVNIIVPTTRRYIHKICDWKHLIEHGDNIKGASDNAIEKQIKDLSLNVGGFDVMHFGHFHKLKESEIADKVLVKRNGCWIEKDSFGFAKFKTYSIPKQHFFGCNKKRVETFNYKIDLRG